MTAPKLNKRRLQLAAKKAKLLTTSEAAELTGYTSDHIALLLRRKLVVGERKGRDWSVDAGALLRYIENDPTPGPKAS